MSKRKVVIVSAALISVVLISLVFYFTLRTPIIGIIKGAENEIIGIDGITYIVDDLAENGANSYSSADRGNFIGVVSNGDITMRVYTVNGDSNGDFIYALWDWEGNFYVRKD